MLFDGDEEGFVKCEDVVDDERGGFLGGDDDVVGFVRDSDEEDDDDDVEDMSRSMILNAGTLHHFR